MLTNTNGATGLVAKRPLDDFHIVDPRSASWVCKKVNESRAYQARVKAWAERELRRAKQRETFFLIRFGRELEEWARRELAKPIHRKRKCVRLPGGEIGFRKTAPRLVITDEARLIAWCKTNLPAAIKVVESVAKTPLNEHLSTNGEIADGSELIGSGETFYIR